MKNNTRILFTQQDIKEKVQSLAKDIAKDIEGEDLLAISLLRGSFIFAADLIREISNYTDKKIEIDFITTSSYGDEEKSAGIVDIISDVRSQVRGRNILIIDDIFRFRIHNELCPKPSERKKSTINKNSYTFRQAIKKKS